MLSCINEMTQQSTGREITSMQESVWEKGKNVRASEQAFAYIYIMYSEYVLQLRAVTSIYQSVHLSVWIHMWILTQKHAYSHLNIHSHWMLLTWSCVRANAHVIHVSDKWKAITAEFVKFSWQIQLSIERPDSIHQRPKSYISPCVDLYLSLIGM